MSMVVTTYALPAAGGAPVVVRCTQLTSRMEISESVVASADMQGLVGQMLKSTGFGTVQVGEAFDIPPSQSLEPFVIAGYPGDHPPNTVPIGNGGSTPFPVSPGGPVTLGTPTSQWTSASATPTTIKVVEYS